MAKRRIRAGKKVKRPQRNTVRKALLIGLGLLAIGGAMYYARKKLIEKKEEQPETTPDQNPLNPPAKKATRKKSGNDNFPLQSGSKGSKVKELQKALNLKTDGSFGTKTEAALTSAGFPTLVDETTFNRIISGEAFAPKVIFNPTDIAKRLYREAGMRNLAGVISVLKEIKSPIEYSAISEAFKSLRLWGKKTIVTELLDNTFRNNEPAKDAVKSEFRRMGLVERTGKWSLAGFEGGIKDLVTTTDTHVVDPAGNYLRVKKNTILGEEIGIANGMTQFRSVQGTIHYVPTSHVKYA